MSHSSKPDMGKKGRRTFLIGAVGAVLAGCRAALTPTPAIEPTQPATSTGTVPPPTSTGVPATPTPANTATPAPTATATTPPLQVSGTASVAYTLPLITRYAGETEATLYFELAQPTAGALLIWPEGSPDAQQVIPLDAAQRKHHLLVEGLTPGTRYQAAVGLGDPLQHPAYLTPWEGVSFRTLGDYPLRFGVIGDAGFGDSTTYALVERLAEADLDFVLHTGDVVYQVYNNDGPADAYQQKWYLPFAPALREMPIYAVAGNHDYDFDTQWGDTHYYYEAVPPLMPDDATGQYYSFGVGDVQFIFLDTQTFFGVPGRPEQQTWLEERLADPAYRWTIPTFHVAAYTSGRRTDSDSIPVRQTWGPLFVGANVPVAFSGHDHNYERLIIGDTTFVVSGGGSSTLYAQETTLEGSQFFAQESHVVLAALHRDRIEMQAVTETGELLDEAVIPLA